MILEVGDFIDRLPSSLLQAGTLDRQRKVEFQSSELYSDLTRGRASVPASTIYQKCADIFSRPISATEDIEVVLPLQKLVEQMSGALQTRRDQVAVENVGEIETPFLQVAQEDNARLPKAAGTSAGPIAPPPGLAASPESAEAIFREHHPTGPISTITPPKGTSDAAAATAGPSAGAPPNLKRPPSTVRASVAGAKIRISGPATPTRMKPAGSAAPGGADTADSPAIPAPSPTSPSHQVTKKTARIQIPPISLRAAGAPLKAGAVAPPAIPVQQPGTATLRPAPAPAAEAGPTFRSTPGSGSSGAAHVPVHAAASHQGRRHLPSRRGVPIGFRPPPRPLCRHFRSRAVPQPPIRPRLRPRRWLLRRQFLPDDRQIVLKLGAVLRGLPTEVLTGDPAGVPDDASIKLPFRLIAPQLASGRVAITFAAFLEAMPAEQRGWLASDADLPEVPLPLPEIFQNLPASALSIRADQVVEDTGAAYLTPFSQKAEEDAKRFGGDEAVAAVPVTEAPVEDMAPLVAAPEVAPALKPAALPGPVLEPAESLEPVEEPVLADIFAEEISFLPLPEEACAAVVVSEEQSPATTSAELPAATPVRDEPQPAAAPVLDTPKRVPAGSDWIDRGDRAAKALYDGRRTRRKNSGETGQPVARNQWLHGDVWRRLAPGRQTSQRTGMQKASAPCRRPFTSGR